MIFENLIIRILEHISYFTSQHGNCLTGNIFPTIIHITAHRLQEAFQQLDQRRLTSSILSDNSSGTSVQQQIQIFQHRRIFQILKVQMFHSEDFFATDSLIQLFDLLCAGFSKYLFLRELIFLRQCILQRRRITTIGFSDPECLTYSCVSRWVHSTGFQVFS